MIRRIALIFLIFLIVPYCIWYWPQWAIEDIIMAYRMSRRRP